MTGTKILCFLLSAQHMAQPDSKVYMPVAQNVAIYDQLFDEYRRLHDYFGRGENDVMKRLKKLRGK